MRPASILVVDDDPSIRMLISRLMARRGYTVTTAVDGQDALEQLATTTPDVIVLDVMMPRLDGFGVLRHLEAARPELLPRTILVTAYPRTASAAGALGIEIVPKPFEIDRLMTAVERRIEAATPIVIAPGAATIVTA